MTKVEYRDRNNFVRKQIACFVAALLSVATAAERATAYWNSLAPGEAERTQPGAARAIELRSPSPPHRRAQRPIILAHAIVVRTSPPQSGVAEANIGKVDVWYDAGIRDAFAALAVVSASGERVDKRDAAIDSADPAHVSVSVNPLAAGKYTVRYRALSADGHLVSGAWEFEVRP
ncbi:copper resistance CopC family protein [Methylocystis sp. S23]